MLTEAQRLEDRIADKDRLIAIEERLYQVRVDRLSEYRGYIDALHVEREKLAAQLQRETAPNGQLPGKCDTVKTPTGVQWDV